MVDARTNYARDISQLVIDTYSNQIGVFHTCIPLSVRAAECWVAGVGFLLLAIFAILALVNKMWLQLGIFAIIFSAGTVILLMSVHILFWIDILKESLEKCRNE